MLSFLSLVVVALWFCIASSLKLPSNFRKSTSPSLNCRPTFRRHAASTVSTVGDSGTNGANINPPNIWNRLSGVVSATSANGNYARNAFILASAIPIANSTVYNVSQQVLSSAKPYIPWISLSALQAWWAKHADKRAAIQVVLVPILVHHAQLVASTVPVVAERISQYAQPSLILLLAVTVLKSPAGLSLLQGALKASAVVGAACLCRDMYLAGSKWRPLEPQSDSYAVITGADEGIGREMSRQLFAHGYNLVLVGRSEDALHEIQRELQFELRQKHQQASLNCTSGSTRVDTTTAASSSVQPKATAIAAARDYRQYWNTLISPARSTSASINVINTTVTSSESKGADTPKKSLFSMLHRSKPPTDTVTSTVTTTATPNVVTTTTTLSAAMPQRVQDIRVIVSDYAEPSAPYQVLKHLVRTGLTDKIEILINAAQSHHRSPLLSTSLHHLHHTLHTNIHYTLTLTRLLAPLIIQRSSTSSAVTHGSGAGSHIGGVSGALKTVATAANIVIMDKFVRGGKNTTTSHVGSYDSGRGGGGGRILFIDSIASSDPAPGDSVFTASKAFINSFAQSLRRELLPHGVLVTVAALGAVRYPHAQHRSGAGGSERRESRESSAAAGIVDAAVRGAEVCNQHNAHTCTSADTATVTTTISTTSVDSTPLPAPEATAERDERQSLISSGSDSSDDTQADSTYSTDADGMNSPEVSDESWQLQHATPAYTPTSLFNIHYTPLLPSSLFAPSLPSLYRHTPEEMAAGLTEHAQLKRNTKGEAQKVPLLHLIPGFSLSGEQAGRAVYEALRTGRGATTPGALNKLYVHSLRHLFPAPARGMLAQMARMPVPEWSSVLTQHRGLGTRSFCGALFTAAADRVASTPARLSALLPQVVHAAEQELQRFNVSRDSVLSLPVVLKRKVEELVDGVVEWAEFPSTAG